jgi:hypothetical protein
MPQFTSLDNKLGALRFSVSYLVHDCHYTIDGNYLVMTCTLCLNTKEIPTYALIDCGATGYAFIDQDFAGHHQLPLCPLKIPCTLEVIDR